MDRFYLEDETLKMIKNTLTGINVALFFGQKCFKPGTYEREYPIRFILGAGQEPVIIGMLDKNGGHYFKEEEDKTKLTVLQAIALKNFLKILTILITGGEKI